MRGFIANNGFLVVVLVSECDWSEKYRVFTIQTIEFKSSRVFELNSNKNRFEYLKSIKIF